MSEAFKFWEDYFELKDGRIKVFRRKGLSKQFYARFKFRGVAGFVQESLKTASKGEAAEVALERYLQYEYRAKQGLSLAKKKFSELSQEYLEYLKNQVARNEIKYRKYHAQKLYVERYFDDYFGDMFIGEIQQKEIDQYREWRKNYWISGKGAKERTITYCRNGLTIKRRVAEAQRKNIPTGSTINSEETALRAIFKFAVMKGYISPNEVVQIRTERVRFNQRASFSESEYKRLVNIARRRLAEAEKTNRDREICLRSLLYNYILIASNCGCRTTELMNLRWRDIEWHSKDAAGNESVIFSVSGKSKSRELVANDCCREYLQRLLDLQKVYSKKYQFDFKVKDEYVFSNHNGDKIKSLKANFNNLLNESGLTRDKNGKKRSLSSLRIFYCTMRLTKGENVDLYDLALNMGSSVEMLQRTYSRLTARVKASRIKSTARSRRDVTVAQTDVTSK